MYENTNVVVTRICQKYLWEDVLRYPFNLILYLRDAFKNCFARNLCIVVPLLPVALQDFAMFSVTVVLYFFQIFELNNSKLDTRASKFCMSCVM